MRLAFCLFWMVAVGFSALAQETLIDHGFRQMYNLEFDEAHRTFQQWEREHPDDPMGPVSDAAAYLYAEFDRLHILQSEFFTDDDSFVARTKPTPDPQVKRSFEAALSRAAQLSAKVLARSPGDVNARFAEIIRSGLKCDYLAFIEKRYIASLREVKAGRAMAEKLIASAPGMYDAYLAVGVENYMLSLKPAPLRWILRLSGAQTNKEEGIRKLRLTAEHGRYLRPYALLLLAVAALRDHDRNQARAILAGLTREFPRNQLYARELARLR